MGGSSGSGGENCLDGLDDDADGEIDCSDSDCTPDFECVDVPGGWTALVAVTSAYSEAPPSAGPCAGGDSPIRYWLGPAGPAACSSCTCGALGGATCGDTPISCAMGNTSCTGAAALSVANCKDFGAPGNKQISCKLEATPLAGGSCPPSGGQPVNPDPWQSVADACALKAAGCVVGKACVPKSTSANQSICVSISGSATCPQPWTMAFSAFTGGSDTRACSACGCTPKDVSCSSDHFFLMSDQGCLDFGPYPGFDSTTCTSYTLSSPLNPSTWSIQRVPAKNKSATGTCTATGGVPSGSVTPSGATTFCCR